MPQLCHVAVSIARSLPTLFIAALCSPSSGSVAIAAALSVAVSAFVSESDARAEEILTTVRTVAGEEFTGTIASWSTTGLAIKTLPSSGGRLLEIANEQLLQVSREQASPLPEQQRSYLVLVDGSRLPIDRFEVLEREATISSSLAPDTLKLSTECIDHVRFLADAEPASSNWHELDAKRPAGDVLVIKKKKSATMEFLTGMIGNVSAEKVDFNWEGDQIPVKRSRIAALAYYHARSPQVAESVCLLTTRDGARLRAMQLMLGAGKMQVTTVCGLALAIPLEHLASADYSAGKSTYLSDLIPIHQKWTPRIGLPPSAELIRKHGQPRRDQSYAGSDLSLAWPETEDGTDRAEVRTYSKGIAVRSRTELHYRLPERMARFVCLAGIDPASAREGSVKLTISGDKRVVWEGPVAGGAAPVEIDVELGRAKELRILVDYGANLDFGDRLHLVEARVRK